MYRLKLLAYHVGARDSSPALVFILQIIVGLLRDPEVVLLTELRSEGQPHHFSLCAHIVCDSCIHLFVYKRIHLFIRLLINAYIKE